jgi:hypothetical protein
MGRALMYALLATLLSFVLASYFLLEHGGTEMREVLELTMHNLTSAPARYEGQTVATSGTLNHNDSLGRYELVAPDANFPLAIRNFDEAKLASLVGQAVRVSGKFGSAGGVHIDADSVLLNSSLTPVPAGE